MIRTSLSCVILVLSFLFSFNVRAQESDEAIEQVESLVAFYKFMLNTVGAANTPVRDKEVIITESFKKVFKDGQVQIEDDLLANRNAITNKNVSAYLRDVDFFFRNITFDFTDIEITPSTRENGETFYLVAFNNVIQATTIEGEPYNNSMKRYIEVNFMEKENDLRIASIYSTRISRSRELRNWWNGLSYEWSRIFEPYVSGDSATNEELLKIAAVDSLNLAGNRFIIDIGPLSAFNNLKYLNISDTRIENLEPIRFSLRLEKLIAANSKVDKLNLLEYFEKLTVLDVSNTSITDISALGRLKALKDLNLSFTFVTIFDPLQLLENLEKVNLSNTAFSFPALLTSSPNLYHLDLSRTGTANINYLAELPQLMYLDLSETYINTLNPLRKLEKLETLRINQTKIHSLEPLQGLLNLKRIYADNTGITDQQAMDFMSGNKGTLVLANTERVMEWWKGLDQNWKKALSREMGNSSPDKEDLIRLINMDSLNLSNSDLMSPDPLTKFRKLRQLNISGNRFSGFGFAESLEYLELLIAENMPAASASGLNQSKYLQAISFKGSAITDLSALNFLNKLQILDVDETPVRKEQVVAFLEMNPQVIVLYQTTALKEWWSGLDSDWKVVFGVEMENPSGFALHRLIESTELTIEDIPVSSLEPLNQFIRLEKMMISNTQVRSLAELGGHTKLVEISCKNGPLEDLEGISSLDDLKVLDVSNTAVDDLKSLRGLSGLEELNASGTNIKKLKGLSELKNLKNLNISNTRVWQLDRLHDIRAMETLICYNTRVSERKIEDFKRVFPDCKVIYY